MNHQHKAMIAELATKYGRQVFHSAYRLLSDTHLAEDVTQEVFLKLFKKPPSTFGSITHWSGYLKSMAISAAIDQLRRHQRRAEDPVEQELTHTEPSSDPYQAMATQRDLANFRAALLQLTLQDAQVFCLRHIEGHSYQEIGDLLNISNSLVGVTLHRAQHKLAQRLGESQFLGANHEIRC